MPDDPSPDTARTKTDPEPVNPNPAVDRGSDEGVIGAGRGDEGVIGAGNALDLVDEVLEALDQDELGRAEELAERFESPDPPDEN